HAAIQHTSLSFVSSDVGSASSTWGSRPSSRLCTSYVETIDLARSTFKTSGLEQRLCFQEVGRVEAFGEPGVAVGVQGQGLGVACRRPLGGLRVLRDLGTGLAPHGAEGQRQGQRAWLAQLLAQGDRGARALERLVRIAQQPESDAAEGEAGHARVLTVEVGV